MNRYHASDFATRGRRKHQDGRKLFALDSRRQTIAQETRAKTRGSHRGATVELQSGHLSRSSISSFHDYAFKLLFCDHIIIYWLCYIVWICYNIIIFILYKLYILYYIYYNICNIINTG